MFHADYYEPEARLYRASQRAHMERRCDTPGCDERVCPDADADGDWEWKACPLCYDRAGTKFDDGTILCGMCH